MKQAGIDSQSPCKCLSNKVNHRTRNRRSICFFSLVLCVAALSRYVFIWWDLSMSSSSGPSIRQWSDYGIPLENINSTNASKDISRKSNDEGSGGSDYSCFPSRSHEGNNENSTIVYLELIWRDLHSETFYSYVHHLCSCDSIKSSRWKLDTKTTPRFYFGPEKFISPALKKILEAYNTTTCGPVLFGTPPQEPDLTIVTTAYSQNFVRTRYGYYKKLDDPRYIFICHDDAPDFENATSVYFLTPRHNNYIVPTHFPPTMIERSRTIIKKNKSNFQFFLFWEIWIHLAINEMLVV